MKFRDLVTTASGNLLRSKLRTLLTIIAIFVGAFTLTLTSALGSGVTGYVNSQLGNLGQDNSLIITAHQGNGDPSEPQKYKEGQVTTANSSDPSGTTVAITQADIDKLKSVEGLSAVTPILSVAPDYLEGPNGDKYKFQLSQVTSDTELDLVAGEQLKPDSKELILPEQYVSVLGFSSPQAAVGQEVTLAISNAKQEQTTVTATVAGVLAKGIIGSSGVVVTEPLRTELFEAQTKGLPPQAKQVYVGALAKMATEPSDANVAAMKKELSKLGYDATTVEDQLGVFTTVIRVVTYVLNGFALIALLAAAFGIVNTLLMSVQERTKEIGLMKAMGMGRRRIFALFSLEAILIGFWGSLLGVAGAMGLGTLLNHVAAQGFLKNLPGFDLFTFPGPNLLFVMGLIMGIAFLAGALPARRAARLDPIEALRYE